MHTLDKLIYIYIYIYIKNMCICIVCPYILINDSYTSVTISFIKIVKFLNIKC